MLKISWVAAQLLASQETVSSMKLIKCLLRMELYNRYQEFYCNWELSIIYIFVTHFSGILWKHWNTYIPVVTGCCWTWTEQGASRNSSPALSEDCGFWHRKEFSCHTLALCTEHEASLLWRWASYEVIIRILEIYKVVKVYQIISKIIKTAMDFSLIIKKL
jgi:hypothetical protein